jgi:hypothetical protein
MRSFCWCAVYATSGAVLRRERTKWGIQCATKCPSHSSAIRKRPNSRVPKGHGDTSPAFERRDIDGSGIKSRQGRLNRADHEPPAACS